MLDTINAALERYAGLFEDGVLTPDVDVQDVTAAAGELYAVLARIVRFLESSAD